MITNVEKIEFERGEHGEILPTMKSRNAMASLLKKHQSPQEVKKAIGEKDYEDYIRAIFSDPRKENIFYTTKEQANKAAKYVAMLNERDRNYLHTKKANSDNH